MHGGWTPQVGPRTRLHKPLCPRSPATMRTMDLLAAKGLEVRCGGGAGSWRLRRHDNLRKPTTQVMVGSGGNGKTRTPMHGAAEGRKKNVARETRDEAEGRVTTEMEGPLMN
ncbi:hypothetical protein BO94DRAFT_27617 [Aspergillus sclerotioniger CBS 115572]|uniref:Uncharacterized protein n=1 Tax=Aspergillus sclerotioniger CBS 115572 TaxID=1450535 RepID=A0A317WWV4_9EURO|nr:hypothetical protein BO94DRAFT_27617 [Aspergillus sclerotioniger CBS 115572]PWY90515.1 hypothetical protein BO94DRAFT_27617 [Aspergillus sclerotioniger CBS 115572]